MVHVNFRGDEGKPSLCKSEESLSSEDLSFLLVFLHRPVWGTRKGMLQSCTKQGETLWSFTC